MNPIQYLISLLAPHLCLRCGNEGDALCASCRAWFTRSSQLIELQLNTVSGGAWAVTGYSGVAKDLLGHLKFQRGAAAATSIAAIMSDALPCSDAQTLVSYVPTANSRVRQRGYDQSELIAKAFAKKRNLRCLQTLRRTTNTRQVGAGRLQRQKQMKEAFEAYKTKRFAEKHIILIDDVMTTGATLESAAALLQKQAAKSVSVATFAYQPI